MLKYQIAIAMRAAMSRQATTTETVTAIFSVSVSPSVSILNDTSKWTLQGICLRG